MFSVKELESKNKGYVVSVLENNKDIFGEYNDEFTFYEIDKNNKLIGFFAICEDHSDVYLSGIYIKKSCRKQGAFNYIVFKLKEKYKNKTIYLNSLQSNELAVKIYSHKFKFIENKNGVIWYSIC